MAKRAPDVKVLILSMHDNEQYFFEALRAGASGYVLKSAADRDLVSACRAAMRGESFLEKLGMHDRVELTKYAIKRGLVEP